MNADRCPHCGRGLQHADQWRCPWVSCRVWLRDPAGDAAVHDTPNKKSSRARARTKRAAVRKANVTMPDIFREVA